MMEIMRLGACPSTHTTGVVVRGGESEREHGLSCLVFKHTSSDGNESGLM